MNKKISIIVIVLIVLALVYWLSGAKLAPNSGQDETQSASSQPTTSIAVTQKGPVGVANDSSGAYLVSNNGLTLYTNVQDAKQTGTNVKGSCNTECEKIWIPYLRKETDAAMTKTTDALLSKLNVINRADGKLQYALGNQPLYTYISDTKLGDLNGSSITGWMVAKP